MKIKDLFEGEVIKHNFGSKNPVKNTDVPIPKGYDRFEMDHKEGSNAASIFGINGNKRTKISTGHVKLVKELVKLYNSGGYSDELMKPMTGIEAFGSPEENALNDIGIKLTEKPSDFSAFDPDGYAFKRNIHQISLKKIEKVLGKLKHYTSVEVFGSDPRGPLINVENMPKENMCIIDFKNGNSYLVDTTQAKSYIRMWQKID